MGKGGKKYIRPRLLELTEYEMDKYRNIQEKNEILRAHGFKPLTVSSMGSNGKRKRIMVDADDPDYRPSFDGNVDDEGDDEDDDDEVDEHQIGGPGRKNIRKEGAPASRSNTPIATRASYQLQVDASNINGDTEQSHTMAGELVKDTASSPIKQKKQGITRGIAHGKKLKPGEKFTVTVPEELLRVVGNDAQAFITEAGIIVRNYAPPQVTSWKSIEKYEKEKLWCWLQEKFQLENVPHVRKAVFQQLNRMYRAWRHRIYKVYFLPTRLENALPHPPAHLKPEDWEYRCRYFDSKEYKDKSTRNQASRKSQKVSHSTGTVSYSRISYNTATGKMMDQIDLWRETHFSGKKKDWVDERSKELYDQMLELRRKSKEEGASPMTDKEICLEILKKRSGYVRGLGPGPKPLSFSSKKTSSVELEEARRRADEAESQARKLSEEVAMLKASQAEMVAKQEETQALVRLMIEELRSRGITRYSTSGVGKKQSWDEDD